MTSQDDVAVLREMRDRGEISDEEYTALRRYVLWGTPLPPGMTGRVAPTPRRQEGPGADRERHQTREPDPATGAHRPPSEWPGGQVTGEPLRGPARPLRRTGHRRGPERAGAGEPPGRGGAGEPPRWSNWSEEPPPGDPWRADPRQAGPPPADPRSAGPRRPPPPAADRPWQFPEDEGTGTHGTHRGGPPPGLPESAGPPPRLPTGRRRADRGTPEETDSRATGARRAGRHSPGEAGRHGTGQHGTGQHDTGRHGTGRRRRRDEPNDSGTYDAARGERRPVSRPGTELEPARPRVPERRDAALSVPAGLGREVVRRERSAAAVRPTGPVRTRSIRLALASGRPAPGRRRRQATRLASAVLALAMVGAGAWWFSLRSSPVQPGVYAHRVCTTVSKWQGQLATDRQQLVTAITTKGAELTAQRGALVAFYQDAEARTADLSVELSKIGPPNVAGGEEYAKELRGAVASSATSFHDEAGRAAELDTSTAAVFGPALQSRLTAIDSRARPVLDALSGQGTEPPLDLRTAFDTEPTCAAYTG